MCAFLLPMNGCDFMTRRGDGKNLLEKTWPIKHVLANQAPTSPTLAYGWKIARTPSMAITAAKGWARRRTVNGTL